MHLFLRTLGLSLFLGLSPAYSAFAFEVDGLSYAIVSTISSTVKVTPSESGIIYSGDITIPESVTYEGVKYAVESIGEEAFKDCSELTNIFIPSSVTSISNSAFENCTGLTEVVIPDGVNRLNAWTFRGCTGLTRITFPQSLTFSGDKSFEGCTNLKTIISANPAPPSQGYIFGSYAYGQSFTSFDATVYVPVGRKDAYTSNAWWSKFGDNIVEFGDVKDGQAYFQDFNVTSRIRYTRSFKNTNWQPLYVPFAIPVDTLTNHGLKLAFLNPTSGDEEATIEFLVASGGVAKPNTPYMIKAEEPCDVVLNFPSVATEATIDNSINCTSSTQKFTFVGTSNGVSGEDMYNNSYYAMAGGMLCLPQDNTVFLKPQRWYMKVENMDGTPAQQAATIRFVVSEEEVADDTTAIETVDAPAATDDAFYTIEGRRTAAPAQSGLFIHQGKIFLIRK